MAAGCHWMKDCPKPASLWLDIVPPPPGKPIAVGKRVGEWVYELFITTLAASGFLVEGVLDLYHRRTG
jgi:hypothetical protein